MSEKRKLVCVYCQEGFSTGEFVRILIYKNNSTVALLHRKCSLYFNADQDEVLTDEEALLCLECHDVGPKTRMK